MRLPRNCSAMDQVNKDDERSSSKDESKFTFTPQQAHIFNKSLQYGVHSLRFVAKNIKKNARDNKIELKKGGQSIFFSFSDTQASLTQDTFYYIVFEGSNIRHITSAKVLNPYTLQAVIPEHDEAELVILTVCNHTSTKDTCEININTMASDTFVFTSDSTQFLTQQLANNASTPAELLNLEAVYSSLLDISANSKEILDVKLTTSFRKIKLPQNWSLAPTQQDSANWTLLHFCAKHNFPLLAEFLMCKQGSDIALKTLDSHGHTPLDVAMHLSNRRMTEILSRILCKEEVEQECVDKHPKIKRHKLGTTTITNSISEGNESLAKDLLLMQELDRLATASQEPSLHENEMQTTEEGSPLSESLRKLHEINDEIRRLRSISYREVHPVEYEKHEVDVTDTNGNLLSSQSQEATSVDTSTTDNLPSTSDDGKQTEDDTFLDISSSINESNDSLLQTTETDQSMNNTATSKTLVGDNSLPYAVEESNENIKMEQKEGSVSLEKIENVEVAEMIEILPASMEEITLTSESDIAEIEITDVDGDIVSANMCDESNTPDFNFKLESVVEETEEELQADGSVVNRRPRIEHSMSLPQTKSLTDLPPHLPKRVGILKKYGAKNDRPLSDSFENLKMVESQGIVDLYQGTTRTGNAKESKLTRGHSLDALMRDVDAQSEPSTASQLSLDGNDDSEESLNSDCDTPKTRSRSGSDKVSVHSYKASSLLSINDIPRSSIGSSHEDLRSLKRGGILSKISFKKAKSMSSLDVEKKKTINDEERRKTYAGDFEFDVLASKTEDNDELFDDEQSCAIKKSQSSLSVDMLQSKDDKEMEQLRNRRVSTSNLPKSYGRNEGHDSEERGDLKHYEIERIPSTEDKRKKKFVPGIFGGGGKQKDKKSQKEKEKKDNRERRDSDGKNKKKVLQSKPEFGLTVKTDSKTPGLFTKRGTSFRQNFKPSNDSKTNDKLMFMRSASASNNNKQDIAYKFLRSSDRRSPVNSRKISTAFHENSSNDPDMQGSLSRTLGGSRTSLDSLNLVNDDDIDAAYIPDDTAWDSDLDARDEPETWSELVDKKIQRKMHAKDIKRQDVIYELIQTEAVYVRVLQVMRKIYARGMVTSLNMDPDVVDQIFPVLDDLIELNGNFIHAMKARQAESQNYCIENIGDILLEFFGGESGEILKQVYGYFCSRHLEAVSVYKEYLKTDKKYSNFMKQCLLNDRSRRMSVPECITYVTIRMTKYPLLIEAIIKATKESKPDYEQLKTSLKLVKEVLVAVDEAVNIYEQEKELKALRKNLDRKNFVEIKIGNQKSIYKTTKLFHKRSRLLYDKKTVLKGKNKSFDARMIVLAEKIIFFQDNGGGKLQLLSADNKAPVLSLKNLMVREVATDNKALFLVSTSRDAAQIYEIICDSYKDKKDFMPKLQQCIKNCPEEEEENLTDLEEEARREEEERISKLKEIVGELQRADEEVSNVMINKNRLVHEMRELIELMDDTGPVKGSPCFDLKAPDITNARVTLESCLSELNLLSSTVCTQPVDVPIASPTPSPGISTSSVNSLSKRSETLGSHERGMKQSHSYGNVNRMIATKPLAGRSSGIFETDSGKPRKQSQLLSVLTRTRTMGSSEDLTSLSSSTSTTSLSTISTTLSQLTVFQSLKDNLAALVDVTNKQDIEIGKMRLELQENRADISKLKSEKKELEDRLLAQQRDSDRQIRNEKEQYAKLTREFKRTTDKLRIQFDEKKTQYQQLLDTYNDLKMGVYSNSKTRTEDGLFV